MSARDAHHLAIGPDVVAGNDGSGRIFLLPGSITRARKIAAHFDDAQVHRNPRRHDVHTGTFTHDGLTVDIGAVGTGMGCPSLGIIVSELRALGVRALLRIGTCGSLQPEQIGLGSLIIATGAVRDEGASDALVPREVPAVAHPGWVNALGQAAVDLGAADQTFRGLVHAKDTFYGREIPTGPLAEQNARYMGMLESAGVLATEMESSHLFLLAQVFGADRRPISQAGLASDVVMAGSILAVIGVGEHWADSKAAARAEDRAIQVGLRAAVELVRG